MKNNSFPSNSTLEQAIIESLDLLGGEASVKEINSKVIEVLNLSDEVVNLEDESGLGTKLNYRLRWCRTNLKGKKMENVVKGKWRLIK